MTVGDVIQFIVYGLINSQTWQTTHHYQVMSVTGSMAEGEFQSIVDEFALQYLEAVHTVGANMFSEAMTWNGVRGENLFNPTGMGEHVYSPALAGVEAGQPLPSHASYVWTTPSTRRGMNAGRRYMPGITETTSGPFGLVQGFAPGSGGQIAAWFGTSLTLEFGGGEGQIIARPVVVKRVRSGQGTDEDPYTYRLPRTVEERVTYPATAWTLKPYTSTMNSRKVGRGI